MNATDFALARLAELRDRWGLDPGLVSAYVGGAWCILGLVDGRVIGIGLCDGCIVQGADGLAGWLAYLARLGGEA